MHKKIFAFLITMGVMLQQVAFADIDTRFDNRNGKLTLSGTLPDDAKDNWVTVEVINPKNNKTVYLTQTKTDAELNYEVKMVYTVDLTHRRDEPLYTVKINYMHDGDEILHDVYYTPDTFTQLWIDMAVSESADKTQEILEDVSLTDIAEELSLEDITVDVRTLAGYVFDKISKNSPATITQCKDCVRETVIFAEIKADGMKRANEYIALDNIHVDKVLGINSKDEMYKLFEASSAKVKTAFLNTAAEYYNNNDEFKKAYAKELLISTIKKSDNNLQITKALDVCGKTALGSIFENSTYTKLSVKSQKEKFAEILNTELKNRELADAFSEAEKKYKQQSETTSNNKPAGGGSSGGFVNKASMPLDKTANTDEKSLITDMFIDLDSVSWAKEAINTLAKENIISGVSEYEFEPSRTVTREEFVKMLVLACGVKTGGKKCDFDDVLDTDWFYPYVSGACEAGIINGISDRFFGTGSCISREDIAVMAYRVLLDKEILSENSPMHIFADSSEISEYAKLPVGAVAELGIINGVGENKFLPSENATRAQAAKIICELTKKLK